VNGKHASAPLSPSGRVKANLVPVTEGLSGNRLIDTAHAYGLESTRRHQLRHGVARQPIVAGATEFARTPEVTPGPV